MNPTQFINNLFCAFITKYKKIRLFIKGIGLILYPDYPFIPKINVFESKSTLKEIVKLYFFIFFIIFFIQAFWSFWDGRFFPDNNDLTVNFLEDYENLWNYLVICQLYVIIGYFFLKRNSNIMNSLRNSGLENLINISDIESKTKSKFGFIGFILLFLLTLYFSSSYAYDVTKNTTLIYWFMDTTSGHIIYSKLGYYYFFINFLLLFFVLNVGFVYVGFINKIGFISTKIIEVFEKSDPIEMKNNWADENTLKRVLAPISTQIFLLQLFVVILSLNLILWNINNQGIGTTYNVSVVALILFGVWLFTLPRYYINYQVFRIWQKIGKIEYKNLNLPWLIGASGFVDLLLFSGLLKYLINDNWYQTIKSLFR